MKKTFSALLLALLVSSCVSTDKTGKSGLDAKEQTNLQNREKLRCYADIKKDTLDFRAEVADLGGFSRGDRWTYTLTKTEGTTNTVTKSSTIYVWKVSGDYLYYLITLKDAYSVTTHRFIRISKTEFNAMITDLANKFCDHATYSTVVGTTSSSAFTHKVDSTETSTGSNTYEVSTTYTFTFANLPFLGSFNSNVVKKEKNSDGNYTNANGVTLKGALSARTSGSFASDVDQYNDVAYTGATFCTLNKPTGAGTDADPYVYSIPYEAIIPDSSYQCGGSADGAGPTTGLEPWPNPGTDLTI